MNSKIKRTLASITAIGATSTLLVACGAAAPSTDTLTVTMWGGTAQEAHIRTTITPWAEETGVKVREDSPMDYAKLEAMVQAKKVDWGLAHSEAYFTEGACERGILEKLPQRVIDAEVKAKVNPAFMSDCGIPFNVTSFNIGYNTELFPDAHPTTWKEFFDTKKFPGKRGFWKSASGGALEAALLADGVAPADLYPLDVERAFAKLDTLDIVWYDTGDQMIQLLSTGETPLSQVWNSRTRIAKKNGLPVADEFNENIVAHEHLVIPKGYANAKLAEDWMVWFLEHPKVMADHVDALGMGPASPQAFDFMDADKAASIPTSEEFSKKTATVSNSKYWTENYKKVTEQFNVWLSK